MTMTVPARSTRCASPSSRVTSAASSVTTRGGSLGTSPGATRNSRPGNASTQRGMSPSPFGDEATTLVPRALRNRASPSMDPMASGSGLTWQTSTASSASANTRAASSSALVIVPLDPPEQLVHPLGTLHRFILLEHQLRQELQADLMTEDLPEMPRRRPEPGGGSLALPLLAEDRVEHDGSP